MFFVVPFVNASSSKYKHPSNYEDEKRDGWNEAGHVCRKLMNKILNGKPHGVRGWPVNT